MVRSDCLLSFDLHTYVHPDGSWHSRLISSLVCQIKVRHTWLLSWLTSVPSMRDKHLNCLFLCLLSLCYLLLLLSVSNSSIAFSLILKTHPSCTKRPSRRSEYGLQWWFDPRSHHSRVWTSVSRVIWCHRPRPTREPWCGQMSCGIHCMTQRHKLLASSRSQQLWCRGTNCDGIVSVGDPKKYGVFYYSDMKLHISLWIVIEKLSTVLTSGSFLPRQGWGCHRWSSFSSWSYQLEQLRKGHWSLFCL